MKGGLPFSEKPVLYLAGPINGCTDFEAHGWRRAAAAALGDAFAIRNPMRRDYRGSELMFAADIVEGDKRDIDESAAVLFYAPRPSFGTAMEMLYAHDRGRYSVAYVGLDRVSPWVAYHTRARYTDLLDAIADLRAWAAATPPGGRDRWPCNDGRQPCECVP